MTRDFGWLTLTVSNEILLWSIASLHLGIQTLPFRGFHVLQRPVLKHPLPTTRPGHIETDQEENVHMRPVSACYIFFAKMLGKI